MKTNYLIITLALLLGACSPKNERSDAYGNFEVDEVMVSAEATGKLLGLQVEEGQKITEGTLVALIDTSDMALKRKQLLAQKKASASKLANINSQIEVYEQQKTNLLVDKNRVVKMLNDGAATQKQLDDVNGNLNLIDKQINSVKTQKSAIIAEMDAMDAQVDQVNLSIEKCRVLNPVTGVVLDKYAESGEITSFGKPLYKIADTDVMYLRVYVSGAQLPAIKLGQEVQVMVDKDAVSNQTLSGVVSWISESAEFTPKIIQTKQERVNLVYAIKIKVGNDGILKIGMPGEVNF